MEDKQARSAILKFDDVAHILYYFGDHVILFFQSQTSLIYEQMKTFVIILDGSNQRGDPVLLSAFWYGLPTDEVRCFNKQFF